MAENEERRIPWILWPFYAVWRLLTFILNITGRKIGVICTGKTGCCAGSTKPLLNHGNIEGFAPQQTCDVV